MANRKPAKRANGLGSRPVKRNGSYSMQVSLGRKKNGTSDRRRVTAPTEDECVAKARELQVLHARGMLPEQNEITVKQAAEKWLKRQGQHVTSRTLDNYEEELDHILKHIGTKQLTKLRPQHIRDALDALATYTTQKGKRLLSSRTQRKAFDHLYSVLQDAVTLETIPRNPAEGLEVKAPPTERVGKALEPEQQAYLLAKAVDQRYYPGLYLLLATGLRHGELLALKQGRDIDLKRKELHVKFSRDKTEHAPKSINSVRTVPLSDDAIEVIKDWYKRLEREKAKAKGGYKNSGYLLVNELGEPISPSALYLMLQRVAKLLKADMTKLGENFPHVRIHDLRHTCATNWLSGTFGKRIPVEVVSQWLGHGSPGTTMRIYAHVLKRLKDEYASMVPGLPRATPQPEAKRRPN